MSHRATCEDDLSDSSDSEQTIFDHDSAISPSPAALTPNYAMQSKSTRQLVGSMIPKGALAIIKPLLEMKHFIFRNAEIAAQFVASLTTWIKAHKKETAFIMTGVILFALCLATPAILGAIGFSAAGPVLGSVSAGWQASMGSVAAGSLFAFLQSAAMGGAAMGLFTGVGVLGAVMATGGGLASIEVVKEKCGEATEKAATVVKSGYQQLATKAEGLWKMVWSSGSKPTPN